VQSFRVGPGVRSTMIAMRFLVRTTAFVGVVVVLAASPAAAAPGTRHWFYWAAPLLTLATIGLLIALAFGYYVKVLRPKYRGR